MFISWFVLLLQGLICSIFKDSISENNGTLCTIVIVISAITVFFEIASLRKSPNMTIIIWMGFAMRLLLFFWDISFSHVYRLPNSGQDTESFANWAKLGYLTGDYQRGGTYARFISFWYKMFGIQRPIAQYVNILLAVSIIYVALKIMKRLEIPERVQKKIITLLCFLPNYAITNSILLRETLIVFVIAIGVYCFVCWIQRENIILLLLLSVVFVCIAATIHSGAIAILLGEALVYILYDKRSKTIRFHAGSILGVAIAMIAFIVLYTQFGDVLFGKFQGVESAADVVNTADRYNSGGSAYDAGFAINNDIASLIINTPIRMFYFVMSPLPWKWRGLTDIIAFCFSSTMFAYAYYRTWQELKYRKGKYRTYILTFLVLALCSALIFAWGVSNAGTAVRHREKFIFVYMILLALCDANKYERRRV